MMDRSGLAFDVWEPVYERILAEFGYDRAADERARDRFDGLLKPEAGAVLDDLDYTGQTVAVAGGASCLTRPDELERARGADAVVAASIAADRLQEAGVGVDCMVTDLDKTPATARELTRDGTPVAVHAHGDNVAAVDRHVPGFDHRLVIPTTQAQPRGVVRNFGGFTDGDRAAFLADALGAGELVFPGWAFDDDAVSAEKRRKLLWAKRLLYWLERRRNQRFGVLDGHRADVDSGALPL